TGAGHRATADGGGQRRRALGGTAVRTQGSRAAGGGTALPPRRRSPRPPGVHPLPRRSLRDVSRTAALSHIVLFPAATAAGRCHLPGDRMPIIPHRVDVPVTIDESRCID